MVLNRKSVWVSCTGCDASMLQWCETEIVYSQQVAPGISHGNEITPCEIRNEPIALL